jgi:PAS domain S-box-containing protein
LSELDRCCDAPDRELLRETLRLLRDDLRHREEEYRRADGRFHLAADSAEIGVWDWDMVRDHITWNSHHFRIFGMEPSLFAGDYAAFSRSIHPEDRNRVTAWVELARFQRRQFEYSYRICRPDGAIRWVRSKGGFHYDANGRAVRMAGTVMDITEQVQGQLLAESEQRFRSTFEQAAVGIAHLGLDGRWLRINRRYCQMVGYEHDEMLKMTLKDISYPGDPGSGPIHPGRVLKENEDKFETEKRYVRKDGTLVWAHITTSLARDEQGAPLYLIVVAQDISARKQAEEALRVSRQWLTERKEMEDSLRTQEIRFREILEAEHAARAEAERAGRLKDEFLATLSHELRTPLNAILGWSQILSSSLGEKTEAAVLEGVQIIERNARAQARIIEEMLDASRIIDGKVRLNLKALDPAIVVREALETAKPAAAAKGIALESAMDTQSPVLINGDQKRLQQMLGNLLSNAVKFTPAGGTVRVSLRQIDSNVEISVADTGDGIQPELLPCIFNGLPQADAPATGRRRGLKLGLSVVKQLAELHGGSVSAHSEGPGKGTTFMVVLPLINPRD